MVDRAGGQAPLRATIHPSAHPPALQPTHQRAHPPPQVKLCSLKWKGREELHQHAAGVSCLSIDGGRLLSGGGDGALHLFDLEEQKNQLTCSLRGHLAPITAAALLPLDGASLAHAISSSADGAVRLWDGGGGLLTELLPPAGAHRPAQPVPLDLGARGARSSSNVVACGRAEQLLLLDLAAEVVSGAVPLPHALPAVHVALDSPSRLVASSSLHAGCVHLWDVRQLPAPPGGQPLAPGAPLWEDLGATARRALVGTLPLPSGFSCARQLHLDECKLFAALDGNPDAHLFSRSCAQLALFDVRAVGAREYAAPPLLWRRPVRGGLSCFQCSGSRLLLGSCAGPVLLWRQSGGVAPVAEREVERDRRKLRTADKKKTHAKVRHPAPHHHPPANLAPAAPRDLRCYFHPYCAHRAHSKHTLPLPRCAAASPRRRASPTPRASAAAERLRGAVLS